MHACFALEVFSQLDASISGRIDADMFLHASTGPDVWMYYRFWAPPFRRGINKRGAFMHEKKADVFLLSLAKQAANASEEEKHEMFSLLAGYLCHYCLDRNLHPYINWLAENWRGKVPLSAGTKHMVIEMILDRRELWTHWKSLWQKPITKELLRIRQYPLPIRKSIEMAYAETYGWIDVWPDLQRSIRDQRMYHRIVQDPTGIVHSLFSLVDKLCPSVALLERTYAHKDRYISGVSNQQHMLLYYPEKTVGSNASVADIRSKAKDEAVKMIICAQKYLRGKAEVAELAHTIGNSTYHSPAPYRSNSNR